MRLTGSVSRLSRVMPIFVLLTGGYQLRAQSEAPAPPPVPPIVNTDKLEVEVVEAHNLSGIPAQIERKAGKFVLVIANRSDDSAAWFTVDPAPADATATATATPLAGTSAAHFLTIGSGQYEKKRRTGIVFDATPGTYQLKFGKTGAVICTIVIG